MSLASMTGYGHGTARFDGLVVEVEVSSVNRKQLDVQVGLPRPLQVLEPRIMDEVGRRASRGRVTVNVTLLAGRAGRPRRVAVDERLARAYLDALRGSARRLALRDDLGLSHVLDLPDVLRVEHPEDDIERLWPAMRQALARALGALVRMRRAEGAALGRDLAARFAVLRRLAARIRRRAPAGVARYREQLLARLRAAGLALDLADERLLREIALFADRADISEEITRLHSHFAQAAKLLRAREPSGRSLDFLAQEMFREINTIGSKAGDAAITAAVVEFKAELERIREQVQNVE